MIATTRNNKLSICLGFQDFIQLERDYGKSGATVIGNNLDKIFSVYFLRDSPRQLSERFRKIVQKRQSIPVSRESTSTSISSQFDQTITASKISNLSQGLFIGSVTDNFCEEIIQKVIHTKILIDNDTIKKKKRNLICIFPISPTLLDLME